jgi:hypothetical protein
VMEYEENVLRPDERLEIGLVISCDRTRTSGKVSNGTPLQDVSSYLGYQSQYDSISLSPCVRGKIIHDSYFV